MDALARRHRASRRAMVRASPVSCVAGWMDVAAGAVHDLMVVQHAVAARGAHAGRDRLVGLALAQLAVVVVLVAASVVLFVRSSGAVDRTASEVGDAVVFLVAGVITPLLGVLLAVRRPSNPIGWLFLAGGVAGAYATFCYAYGEHGLVAHRGSLPAADWVLWSGAVGLAAFYLPGVFGLLLFPNGTLVSRHWRSVVWIAVAAMTVELISVLLSPDVIEDFDEAEVANPARVDRAADAIDMVGAVAGAIGGFCVLAAAMSLVVRFRRSGQEDRRKVAFFGLVVAAFAAFGLAGNTVGGGYGENIAITVSTDLLLMVGLPGAIAAGILWRGLYGIERVVNRTVVFWLLSAFVVGGCAALAWAAGVTAADHVPVGVAALVTVLVMLALEPVRRVVSRWVDHRVFGGSPRGYEMAADFAATVDRTGDVGALAARLAELVCRGLDTRWARARFRVGTVEETVGECTSPRVERVDGDPVISVPIVHRGVPMGVVECGAKLEGEFVSHDRRLLELLAKEAAMAAHGLDLAASLAEQVATVQHQAAELAASRSRIVAAQEAERRRIERNIHDGAQQELVALIAKVRLARDQLGRNPAETRATLEEIQFDVRAVLRDIRELAQGIHPTVLADQGLVRAIENRATRLTLDVRLQADPAVRTARYDDAVEGAAFFVVSEALANVLKHADASCATVTVAEQNATLAVSVHDDGRGFVPATPRGTGLVTLSDRVEAVGGRLQVCSVPAEGTMVRAEIPTRQRGRGHG